MSSRRTAARGKTGGDSDAITVCASDDNFVSMIFGAASNIQFKLFALILILFLVLHTDVFARRVLSGFEGAVDMDSPTHYGLMIMGLFMFVGCVALDAAISQKIV